MAFKFVLLFASLAAVNAGVIQPAGVYQSHTAAILPSQHSYVKPAIVAHQPVATYIKPAAVVKHVVHEEPANYEFHYEVHDTHTGDIKRQHEKAENGVIHGQYSLVDADGYHRIVDYTADDHHGFQANVRREPLGHEQKIVKQVAPVVVKKVVTAPVVTKVVSPVQSGWQAPNNGWQVANNGWQAPNTNAWQASVHTAPANPWYG